MILQRESRIKLLDGQSLIVYRDLTNHSVGWGVEGTISTEASVSGMLQVIDTKDIRHTGTFWSWNGNVRQSRLNLSLYLFTNEAQICPW